MEAETGVLDGMDILKDITRGLRGRDEGQRSKQSRTTIDSQSNRMRRSSANDSNESGGRSEGNVSDRGEDDDHVCSFCQTEFEANRGACPDCGAELVLRGDR